MTPVVPLAPQRIAVIGREGQLARALIQALQAGGQLAIVIARPDVDLAEPASLRDAIIASRADAVVNTAAYTAVDRAEDEPDAAFAINATGAGAVAEAAAAIGAPVVHVSTDYVFDGGGSRPYLETDATAPLGVYGRSKLEGEVRVAAANPRHVILRTAWLVSPHGQNFVKTMLRLAADRPELRVVDDQHGCPTFAADLAHVIVQLLPRLISQAAIGQHHGIFHATNVGETTWCGFARAIMAGAAARGARGVPVAAIPTSAYPTKARRPAYSVLATGKLSAVYGVQLPPWTMSLEACLDDLIGQRLDPAAS